MPLRSLHKCPVPGCSDLTRQSRCEKHAKEKATYDQHRPNSNARGYTRKWGEFRLHYLQENPLCEDCLAHSRTEAASEVHHIVKVKDNRAVMYDKGNLMALCHACHSRRTARGE